MHCMPTHPGEEVDQSVLDSNRSIIFDQANRLHMQKSSIFSINCNSSENEIDPYSGALTPLCLFTGLPITTERKSLLTVQM